MLMPVVICSRPVPFVWTRNSCAGGRPFGNAENTIQRTGVEAPDAALAAATPSTTSAPRIDDLTCMRPVSLHAASIRSSAQAERDQLGYAVHSLHTGAD